MDIKYSPMKGATIQFHPDEMKDCIMFLSIMAEGFRQMGENKVAEAITTALKEIAQREPPPNRKDS